MLTTGAASVAIFSTIGGSASRGSWLSMALILSRTSCAATSESRERENWMLTSERPSEDTERSSSMPEIVLTASSMRFDTWVSTSSGAAPRKVVVTVTIGSSIFGKKSTPNCR